MEKIVLIASGDINAVYANNIKKETGDPNLEVYNATMLSAWNLRNDLKLDVDDILLSRQDIVDLMDNELYCQYSEIEIHDHDFLDAIQRARLSCPDKSTPIIAYVGIEKYIKTASYLLKEISLNIRTYFCYESKDVKKSVRLAIEDGADVLICGAYASRYAKENGIPFSILCATDETLKECYYRAVAMRNAIRVERHRSERRSSMLNAVTDGLIGIDTDLDVEVFNLAAQKIFNVQWSDRSAPVKLNVLVPHVIIELCEQVIESGKSCPLQVFEHRGKTYAMTIRPVSDSGSVLGASIMLQEQESLSKIETKMRRSAALRGNVASYTFDSIIGVSPQIRRSIEIAADFAEVNSNVLIYGSTGTGKEMFAQGIHNASSRKNGPFVAVNCGAIPSSLLESEFFGYVDGAFTGAQKGGKAGYFEMAHNGTLFLDEVSELDMPAQIALLRVIQERCVRRIGSGDITPVNARIIAASNTNLKDAIENGRFRRDLYYRLCVLSLRIPDLCERPGDTELIAKKFFDDYNKIFKKSVVVTDDAIALLAEHSWDGNIRQLRNFCERLIAISHEQVIDMTSIRRELDAYSLFETAPNRPSQHEPKNEISVKGRIIKRSELEELMRKHFGSRALVAEELGISKTTLWKILRSTGLS